MERFDKVSDELLHEITLLYRDIETQLVIEIAKQLNDMSNLSPQAFIAVLKDFNLVNESTLAIISKVTGTPLNEVKRSIQKLGYESIDLETMDKAYKSGFINKNPVLIDFKPIIDHHKSLIDRDMQYIQKQLQVGLYRDTYRELKKASLSVELGIESPNQAIAKAVKNLAEKGITGDTFLREGKEVSQGMESVVRRAVRTSFTQTMSDMNKRLADELDIDTFYMSQHLGARTTGVGLENHAEWQGKVYDQEELVTVCGQGNDKGYEGYGCRHIARPFIIGISVEPPPLINMDELERVYALEQKQRTYESRIRDTKLQIRALEELNTDEATQYIKDSKQLLKRRQKRIREYIKDNEDVLRRDYSREKI